MNLTSPLVVKQLLKKHNLWAKKTLGQHFLTDKNILEKIIQLANLSKKDIVLEVGAGIGTLTKALSNKAKRIIAVEIDRKMVGVLKETLKDVENVEIIQSDILKIRNLKLKNKNYKIVANIPYKITSAILEKFLTAEDKPSEIILLVQKEVGQKICSQPPDMNRLGILVQFYGKPEIIARVSKNCFWPRSKVDSVVIKIYVKSKLQISDHKQFFDLIRKGFSQKRKQLKNIFNPEILKNVGIKAENRAEELKIEDWIKLYEKEGNG